MLKRRDVSAIYKAALIGLAVLFVWLTVRVDMLIFGGVLLATCLCHATGCLERRSGLPRGAALTIVILSILVAVGATTWFFSNRLVEQFGELSQRLSGAIASITASVQQTPIGHGLGRAMQSDLLGVGTFNKIFGVASNLIEIVVAALVIAFTGVYGAAEPDTYTRGFLRLVPPERRARTAQILAEAGDALWAWVIGRLCAMAFLGCLTTLGLWALGVPAPVALGVLAGLLVFVPYVGAFVSAVPAVLLAFAVGTTLAVYVVALYLAIHAIESYLLIPLVQRRAAHLPPVLILVSQLIAGVLVGFVGILFATPALAAILVLVRAIYVEDVLGESR